MSDETEHGEIPPDNCNVPGCCFHSLINAKVRTLVEDGENYVNVHDVSMWLVNWHAWQIAQLRDSMLSSGIPPQIFESQVMNNIAGASSVVEILHEMHELPVADDLTSETYLVTPRAMKDIPDTVPAEWTHDKENAVTHTIIERAQYDEYLADVKSGEIVEKSDTPLTYEQWLADEYDAEVITLADIVVIDYDPGSSGSPSAGNYGSQMWDLTIKGVKFRHERWYTENSGGSEWYDEEGVAVSGPGETIVLGKPIAGYDVTNNVRSAAKSDREATIDDLIDEIVDKVDEVYGARYTELVDPIIKQIKTEVFPFTAS